MIALYFGVIVINIICLIRKKNIKLINAINVLCCIVLIGGNSYNMDYPLYEYYYNNRVKTTMGIGYTWFSNLCYSIGITFQSFLLLMAVVSMGCICFVAWHEQIAFCFFSVIYLTTLVFLDAVQFRQFFAYSLFTLGVFFLCKGNKVLYIALILLAITFHITAIAFLPLAFIDDDKKLSRIVISLIIISSIIASLITFSNGNSIPGIKYFVNLFILERNRYVFETRTRFGFLKKMAYQTYSIYLAGICDSFIKKYGNEKEAIYSRKVNIAIKYSCFAFPFVMMNSNFGRFFKYGSISLIILMAMVFRIFITKSSSNPRIHLNHVHRTAKIDMFIVFSILFAIVYWLCMQVSSAVIDVLTNNCLL